MKAAPIIIGGLALGSLWLLTRAAGDGGRPSIDLQPDKFYYCFYVGPNKTFKAALGDCYPVIYTIDVFDTETNDWLPPVNPDQDILLSGSKCRVMVQAPCTIYNFELGE